MCNLTHSLGSMIEILSMKIKLFMKLFSFSLKKKSCMYIYVGIHVWRQGHCFLSYSSLSTLVFETGALTETSKSVPSNILPTTRPHELLLFKQCHSLRTMGTIFIQVIISSMHSYPLNHLSSLSHVLLEPLQISSAVSHLLRSN